MVVSIMRASVVTVAVDVVMRATEASGPLRATSRDMVNAQHINVVDQSRGLERLGPGRLGKVNE